MIKKRHLHRRKVPERCFIVYSKSLFSDQADFLGVLTPIFTPEVGYMNSRSYVIFLTYCWCTLSAVDRHDRGRDRAGQGARQGAKISKNRYAARRKNLFLRAFSDFFKNFYALKTPVFACFRLFCEPLRARAISLYFKKNGSKNFFEKGVDSMTSC